MPETDDKFNIEKYLKVHEWKKQDIDLNAYYCGHVHILHMKKIKRRIVRHVLIC